MITSRLLAAASLSLVLTGCANLQDVRDFAGESARLSAYTELTTRFRDTYQREQPYLSGPVEQQAQANDKRRRDAYPDLLKIHHGVALYMQTLATLAGDDAFDLSPAMDSLTSGIKAYPEGGIDSRQVDAYASMAKIVAKWMTSAAQEKAVREMVMEGDPSVQAILDGMAALVSYYRKTNDNERKAVLGFLEVELAFAGAPKDKLLAALGKAHLQAKIREYQVADARYGEAEAGIASIKEGHKALARNVDNLSTAEAKAQIKKLTKDIKAIRSNLQAASAY